MEANMMKLITLISLAVFVSAVPLDGKNPKLKKLLDIPELNLARKGRHLLVGYPGETDEVLCAKEVFLLPEGDGVVKSTLSCPPSGETNDRNITSVQAWDLNVLEDGGEDPKILSGGLGKNQVSVEVSSPPGGYIGYIFIVFGPI